MFLLCWSTAKLTMACLNPSRLSLVASSPCFSVSRQRTAAGNLASLSSSDMYRRFQLMGWQARKDVENGSGLSPPSAQVPPCWPAGLPVTTVFRKGTSQDSEECIYDVWVKLLSHLMQVWRSYNCGFSMYIILGRAGQDLRRTHSRCGSSRRGTFSIISLTFLILNWTTCLVKSRS